MIVGADPPPDLVTQGGDNGRPAGADEASLEPVNGLRAQLNSAGFADAQEIGRGGFGVVYRCEQAGLARSVAVKVLTEGMAESRARFLREQEAMGRLTGHPNIVAVLEVGKTADGRLFLVMPYCAGGCWQARIARAGVLGLDEVLRVGVKIAGALESAHRVGVLHRDVKPDNILLTDFGEPALCDFGIARTAWGGFETGMGMLLGSPAYIAPEILTGSPPSAASDVYGLGASLFAALTGHAAFERRAGEEAVAQFLRVSTDPVPDLRKAGIPDEVATIVERAMARDPSARPSALELGELMQDCQARLGLATSEMAVYGTAPDRQHAAHAARGQSLRTGKVPELPIGVVGRDQDVARLSEQLAHSRLVTLVGTGGVGKTTLAIHALHEVRSQFADGVWWLELAELRDGALLIDFVAASLGVRDQPGIPLIETLGAFLAHRGAFMVLDNCEHIIEDVTALVDALLCDCPRLRIVATSREVLGSNGESVMALSPLAVPDMDVTPTVGSLSAFAGVALFVQRARAAQADFTLTERNAQAVGRVCAQLDGLPLALELAAARLRSMSVDEIADGLSDRYSLLTRGRRGAPSRQQTLSGCVGWSYDLCTATEQRLWARLSVFAGSFEPAAAHAVCGDDLSITECRDVLADLVDKSILVRSETDGGVRFRLLETLREYGKARIEDSEEYPLLRRRHADWCQRLLADADTHWFGPDQLGWIERLIVEMPNIREALRFAMKDLPEGALRLTADLRRLWLFRGMLGEGRRWLELALSAASPEPRLPRVRCVLAMTQLATLHGDLAAAQSWGAQARVLLDVVDDPTTRAMIEFIDGFAAFMSGDIAGGCDRYQRAITASDDIEPQVWARLSLGTASVMTGDIESGLAWYEKADVLAEERGDFVLRSHVKSSVALGRWVNGDLDLSKRALTESLQLAQSLYDAWTVAQCLELAAWVIAGECEREAVVLMTAALAVSRAAGCSAVAFAEMGQFHAECERRARTQLTAAEFDEASGTGNSMDLDQAVAFAVGALGDGAPG